ncbi:hypothetical protein QZH41_007235 [Actinostola sp. cb2023]|nr:hypothetical protein QZH41_007235 [Actinostola sp. cb2023]
MNTNLVGSLSARISLCHLRQAKTYDKMQKHMTKYPHQQTIQDFLIEIDEASGGSHDDSPNIVEGRLSVYLSVCLQTAVPAADGVDIKASIACYLDNAIQTAFKMSRDLDDVAFSVQFPSHIRQSSHDLCILLTMCLRDGLQGADNLLGMRLPESPFTREVSPLMLQTFQATAVQFLHNVHAQHPRREDTLRQYIKTQGAQREDAAAPRVEQTPAEACEVSSQKSDDSEAFATPPLSMSANDIEEYAPLEDHDENTMELDEREEEDWKAVVPEDWVPIIARDVIRQRRLPQQAPFSDAYLSGLPPKRRKCRLLLCPFVFKYHLNLSIAATVYYPDLAVMEMDDRELSSIQSISVKLGTGY